MAFLANQRILAVQNACVTLVPKTSDIKITRVFSVHPGNHVLWNSIVGIFLKFRNAKEKVREKNWRVNNGCRYTCLLELLYFDPVSMHNLYLGTAKHIFKKIWIAEGHLDDSDLQVINKKISTVCVPPHISISRLPLMTAADSYTAKNWMVWVNYYSLFCLYALLPQSHFECWRHFVLASRLVSKRPISTDEIKLADALFLQFCKKFVTLYGASKVTPNMHLTLPPINLY